MHNYDRRDWATLVAVALMVLAVVMMIGVGVQSYLASRDIDGWIYRAQVAANAEKVGQRLDTAIANMEKYEMTSGHAALIFPSPDNDVGLDYEALKDLRSRAERVSEYDWGSTEYQVALDDIRGTLREIGVGVFYFKLIRNPLTFFSIAFLLIGGVVLWKEWW